MNELTVLDSEQALDLIRNLCSLALLASLDLPGSFILDDNLAGDLVHIDSQEVA